MYERMSMSQYMAQIQRDYKCDGTYEWWWRCRGNLVKTDVLYDLSWPQKCLFMVTVEGNLVIYGKHEGL